MALRRPRLKLQPNVVSRPAVREAEPPPAEEAAAPPADTAEKPRPQLPSRFKRLAPRLDVGRPSAAPAAERKGGSTVVSTDGSTAADAPAIRRDASPEKAAAVDGAAVTAKRARHASGPGEPEGEGAAAAPEPPAPEEAEALVLVPLSVPAPPTDEIGPDPLALPEPQPKPEPLPLQPAKRRKPELPSDENLSLAASKTMEETGFSEADLYLRKRFKVPARSKSSYHETLHQITERVSDNLPIRSKMTMKDLIYWNPSTEAMSNSTSRLQKKERKSRNRRDSVSSVMSSVAESCVDDPESTAAGDPLAPAVPAAEETPDQPQAQEAAEEDEPVPVPQLKVAADGSIIIDEQSLVVKTNQQRQCDQELGTEVMCDVNGSRLSFNGYRQRRHINEWSIKETARFYKALSTVGTDFSIMQQLFPNRSRVDLKKKFKKEERCNAHLVERALRQDMQYDLAIFDDDVWETSVEKCKTFKQKLREERREAKRTARAKDVAVRRDERSYRKKNRPELKAKVEKVELQKAAAAEILSSMGEVGGVPAPEHAAPAGEEAAAVTDAPADAAQLPAVAGIPPGVLQLPSGINPQNLLIIASPSADRPEGQVLHVYMIQPAPGQQAADVNVTIPHGAPQQLPDGQETPAAADPEQDADVKTVVKVTPGEVSRDGAGDQGASQTASADTGVPAGVGGAETGAVEGSGEGGSPPSRQEETLDGSIAPESS